MPKTPKGIFSDKMDLIDQSGIKLKNSYRLAERWLMARIIESVIPELEVEDGVIKNTNANQNIITNKLNVVFAALRTGRNRDIVDDVLGTMGKITKANNSYFGIVGDLAEKKFVSASDRVSTIMKKSLGFNPDGTIRPNSFLAGISNNDEINAQIRDMAIRNIQGGNTVRQFTEELRDSIVTDKNGLGIMNRYYSETVNDRFAQYDRAEAKGFADELKMQAFIYSGGKVADTRKFCCQRNGKVFTRDESKRWSSMKWSGKNRGYVPLIDMGGYNCRHSPQWISNRVALRRRPDLELNENGKLVPKKGQRKPKLNRC